MRHGLPTLQLPRYTPDLAPKGVPLLVAGSIAMKKTGGRWVTGMDDKPFTRELNWEPAWWAHIPEQNTI